MSSNGYFYFQVLLSPRPFIPFFLVCLVVGKTVFLLIQEDKLFCSCVNLLVRVVVS